MTCFKQRPPIIRKGLVFTRINSRNIGCYDVHADHECLFIAQGPRVDEFEKKLTEYFGNPHPLTLNSGTSGLQLAIRLAGVEHGDEVIATPMTCTASNMPILAAGAKIVWADVDPVTGNMD